MALDLRADRRSHDAGNEGLPGRPSQIALTGFDWMQSQHIIGYVSVEVIV